MTLPRHRSLSRCCMAQLSLLVAWTASAAALSESGYASLPPGIQPAAKMLDKMGFGKGSHDDIAGRLAKDWEAGKVAFGDKSDPETGGWPSNSMSLPRLWDNLPPEFQDGDVSLKVAEARAYTTVDRALTLLHEYVHMDQSSPGPTPEFEDLAWQKGARANIAWMRRLEDETNFLRRQPASQDKLNRLSTAVATFEALRNRYADSFGGDGLENRIAEGNVSRGLQWPVFKGTDTTNLTTAREGTIRAANLFLDPVKVELENLRAQIAAMKPAIDLVLVDLKLRIEGAYSPGVETDADMRDNRLVPVNPDGSFSYSGAQSSQDQQNPEAGARRVSYEGKVNLATWTVHITGKWHNRTATSSLPGARVIKEDTGEFALDFPLTGGIAEPKASEFKMSGKVQIDYYNMVKKTQNVWTIPLASKSPRRITDDLGVTVMWRNPKYLDSKYEKDYLPHGLPMGADTLDRKTYRKMAAKP